MQIAPQASLAAGTVSFISSGPSGITVSSTDATGGSAPYTYQWQRNTNGGGYSNITDGFGVSGATTLNLFDGLSAPGALYGYQLIFTDAGMNSVTSNAVTAQVYVGGSLGGSGIAFSSGMDGGTN